MNNDYYKNLPRKRMGVGTLIMNEAGEILIVKPSYNDRWSVAGGVIEENESPRFACQREVAEEIGLDLPDLKFLCVDYCDNWDDQVKGEALQFLFFGGRLSVDQIKKIKIDGAEIVNFCFVKREEAMRLVGAKLAKRLQRALEALEKETAVYLENGE